MVPRLPSTCISKPHTFLFKRDGDGKVRFWYKDYCSTYETWKGKDDQFGVDVFHHLPQGNPQLCGAHPLTEEILTKYQQNLNFVPLSEQDWLLTVYANHGIMKDCEVDQNIFSTTVVPHNEPPQSSLTTTTTITTTSSRVTSRYTSKNVTSEHLAPNGYIFIRKNPDSTDIFLGRIRMVNNNSVIVNLANLTTKGEDFFVSFGLEEFTYPLSAIESKTVGLTKKSTIKVKNVRDIKKRALTLVTYPRTPQNFAPNQVANYFPQNIGSFRAPSFTPQDVPPHLQSTSQDIPPHLQSTTSYCATQMENQFFWSPYQPSDPLSIFSSPIHTFV
eukprot:TRINITY_DN470_c0_g1_i1.p2 TRINITY_DN470_c0_g1~~TRINITY_DN470_c0_g1_i1.p2  ORF type:complete len:330 (-),score=47.86 TRINITY_DN470_c0_g1_i1:41-1030(-)